MFPYTARAGSRWVESRLVHLFPTPCPISLPCHLEMDHRGSIYTMEMDRGCSIRAFPRSQLLSISCCPIQPSLPWIFSEMSSAAPSLQTEGVLDEASLSWPPGNHSYPWVCFLVSFFMVPLGVGLLPLESLHSPLLPGL